jgi:1-acyl-sn-glycerol-3-phosphate acyltransferase
VNADTSALPNDEESLAGRVLALVRALAAELHPEMTGIAGLDAAASIEGDFGLDSLARVELGLRIERLLGTTVPDSALAESETVRDLARALLRAGQAAPAVAAPRSGVTLDTTPAPGPVAARTLLDAIEWRAAHQPERTHILLIDREAEPERISFRALRDEAVAVAAGLRQRGVRPGDTVALMLPTGREFFAAFHGTLYAGAIPVPLYPPARASQIQAHLRRVSGILANCQARVLLTFERAKPLAQMVAPATRLELTATVAEIAVPQPSWTAPAIGPRDTAFLQYTSGSTGQPKGVVVSHANLMANLHAMQTVTGVTSADCFVSWLPLYHDMGLIGACFGALIVGFPLILMSPFAFLSHPARWLRAIASHRATITAAPNFAYEICVNKIDERELAGLDLSSLRLVFNGAEAVSAGTMQRFAERFARYGLRREALMPVYGLAECALGLTFPPAGRAPLVDRVVRDTFLQEGIAHPAPESEAAPLNVISCGLPLPAHSVRIVDESGSPVPERVQGRIQFQGPSATSGYFRNPAETARLFDGTWLDTGDLGYLAGGELYVTGRAKDIIIRGGHNIHPQELEEAVAQLADVRKGGVAVFPATDTRDGTERVVVLAETREEHAAARAALRARINRLAIDLIGLPVDEIVLAPPRTVLKTSSGKIRRNACREAYERGELGGRARAAWLQLLRFRWIALATQLRQGTGRLLRMAWGGWALLVAGSLALPLWIGVVCTPGLQRRRRVGAAFVRLALLLCGVSLPVRQRSALPPAPRVFVANHASYLDSLLLITALPKDVAFVAKQELAGNVALGRLLERLGCVFVERFEQQGASAGAAELPARLAAGESLLVFAEGTFVRAPGLRPFHMGAFTAAAATGAAVVPVALCGTRDMLPDETHWPRPASIRISIGDALKPEDASWQSAVELRRRARAHILAEVHEPDLEQRAAGTLA